MFIYLAWASYCFYLQLCVRCNQLSDSHLAYLCARFRVLLVIFSINVMFLGCERSPIILSCCDYIITGLFRHPLHCSLHFWSKGMRGFSVTHILTFMLSKLLHFYSAIYHTRASNGVERLLLSYIWIIGIAIWLCHKLFVDNLRIFGPIGTSSKEAIFKIWYGVACI